MQPDEPPFDVFLDTEVFRAQSCDWSHENFQSLRTRVDRGSIQLLTTDIVVREVQSKVSNLLNEWHQTIQKAANHKGLPLAATVDERARFAANLAEQKPDVKKALVLCADFFSELGFENLAFPATTLSAVLKDYFSGEAPFDSKDKKAEFPDAINLQTLLERTRSTGKPVFVVSGDGDWKRACDRYSLLVYVPRLSNMLDRAVRAEWRSLDLWSDDELLSFIEAKKTELRDMLELNLERESRVNYGEGYLDSLDISDLQLEAYVVTDITDCEETIIFRGELFHQIDYTASASIEDQAFDNVLEEDFSGTASLVAMISVELPLSKPSDIRFTSIEYKDGLSLEIATKF